MSVDAEVEDKFKKIGEIIATIASMKLSALLNTNVELSYMRLIDSYMTDTLIEINENAVLTSAQTNEENGPISFVSMNHKEVMVVADLAMGGDADFDDDIDEIDEDHLVNFKETFDNLLKAMLEQLTSIETSLIINIEESEIRLLEPGNDESLEKPANIKDPIGLGFKIQIGSKLDAPVHLEMNAALVENLVEILYNKSEFLDLSELEDKLKDEFKAPVRPKKVYNTSPVSSASGTGLEDLAYKVDRKRNLNILKDINMELILELGRSELTMKQVLQLAKGSAIELDRPSSEPVDLYVHNQLVARGEVVAIDDSFGLKITEVTGDLDLSTAVATIEASMA